MATGACPDGCEGGWTGERCDTGTSYYMVDKMQQIPYNVCLVIRKIRANSFSQGFELNFLLIIVLSLLQYLNPPSCRLS